MRTKITAVKALTTAANASAEIKSEAPAALSRSDIEAPIKMATAPGYEALDHRYQMTPATTNKMNKTTYPAIAAFASIGKSVASVCLCDSIFPPSKNSSRIASSDDIGWDVRNHGRPSADNGALADSHSRADESASRDPRASADGDRGAHQLHARVLKIVRAGAKVRVLADGSVRPERDLRHAIAIDARPEAGVLSHD